MNTVLYKHELTVGLVKEDHTWIEKIVDVICKDNAINEFNFREYIKELEENTLVHIFFIYSKFIQKIIPDTIHVQEVIEDVDFRLTSIDDVFPPKRCHIFKGTMVADLIVYYEIHDGYYMSGIIPPDKVKEIIIPEKDSFKVKTSFDDCVSDE